MIKSCCSEETRKLLAAIAGGLGCFLVIGVMAWLLVRSHDATAAADAARGIERARALADIRAANAEVLGRYKLEDPNKGWVRLPISRAMELVAQEWQDPAQGREKLLLRYKNSTNVVSFE